MRHLSWFLALTASLLVTPVVSAEETRNPTDTITEFATTVNAGRSIDDFGFTPAPLAAELIAVQALAGCVPSVNNESRAAWFMLDWRCENGAIRERQTGVAFERDGTFALWINPSERNFSPTAAALSAADIPGQRALAIQFARAVRRGEDPTLNGLIPITTEHRARLSQFAGLEFRSATGNSRSSQTFFWDLSGRQLWEPVVTDLRFDEQARPIGLIINGTGRSNR